MMAQKPHRSDSGALIHWSSSQCVENTYLLTYLPVLDKYYVVSIASIMWCRLSFYDILPQLPLNASSRYLDKVEGGA